MALPKPDFAPLLDWELPYNTQLMKWSAQLAGNPEVTTLSYHDGLPNNTKVRENHAYAIESPIGIW